LVNIDYCLYVRHLSLYVTHLNSLATDNSTIVESSEVDVVVPKCIEHACLCKQYCQRQSMELSLYLIADVLSTVTNYALDHLQHFSVSMPIAIKDGSYRWYVGTLTRIVLVNDFPFLHIHSESYSQISDDWVPAASAFVRCFYRSNGKCIDKAAFLSREQADNCNELLDRFNTDDGTWIVQASARCIPMNHAVYAAVGTFTS